MRERDWDELTAPERASLLERILRVVIAVVVIAVGAVLAYVVVDLKDAVNEDKTEIIDAGQKRLARSLEQAVRTQTLVCLAHPEITDRGFRTICADVIRQWEVNTDSTAP